jgi:hypothetical protein
MDAMTASASSPPLQGSLPARSSYEAASVGGTEGASDVGQDADPRRKRHGGVGDARAERPPFDELHHDERDALVLADVEDANRPRSNLAPVPSIASAA